MTTRDIDYTEAEEKQALKKIIAEEVRKEKAAQLEARRRQRQQEQLAQQVEAANSEFESRLAVLRERMAAVTQRQTEWRQRLESLLNEMDALSDSQPAIQAEIRAILTDVQNAAYEARQKGALIAADTQTHWDRIGGGSADLWPWPSGVSNARFGVDDTVGNSIALNIYSGSCYRPDMMIDGRRRA